MKGTMKETAIWVGHGPVPGSWEWDTVLACGDNGSDVPFTSAVVVFKELGAA
jgi:hypothetical protein